MQSDTTPYGRDENLLSHLTILHFPDTHENVHNRK